MASQKMFSEKDLRQVYVFDTGKSKSVYRLEDVRVPQETRKPQMSKPKYGRS